MNSHIILIGFKHSGKSTIGLALSEKLNMHFVDLDQLIEQHYAAQEGHALNCREIMRKNGELFFRHLESQVLQQTLNNIPMVLALGGGTPLKVENQHLIRNNHIIHITAPQEVIFSRIQQSGQPAFFPPNEEPITAFSRLWEERMPIYHSIAQHTVNNDTDVMSAADKISKVLS